MQYLDATFATPEENLACDEALLDLCEDGHDEEVLRVWEPNQHFVVLGYSNKVSTGVFESVCRSRKIQILRRCTGGGTVLQGPGCLNYSLILRIDNSGSLATIAGTNSFVMNRHRKMIQSVIGKEVKVEGRTDLVIGDLKFSGNSQRRRSRCLLFHGTFLLNFELALISELLPMPSRQPDYRASRTHDQFIANLELPARTVKEALCGSWQASIHLDSPPNDAIARLVSERYSRPEWTAKF